MKEVICQTCKIELTEKEQKQHIWGIPKCSKCFIQSFKRI